MTTPSLTMKEHGDKKYNYHSFPQRMMTQAEFCEVPSIPNIEGRNLCNQERGYVCTQTEVVPTTWSGAFLNILIDGWFCRLLTQEVSEDYEVRLCKGQSKGLHEKDAPVRQHSVLFGRRPSSTFCKRRH